MTAPLMLNAMTALFAAWRRRRQRRALQALRDRALDYAGTQPGFAADLAAATGCALDGPELVQSSVIPPTLLITAPQRSVSCLTMAANLSPPVPVAS